MTSDGTLKWTSKGNVSYTFTDLLFLTAVSDHVLTFPEGQRGTVARMPSSTLIPFLGGLGSRINPFKQKGHPF